MSIPVVEIKHNKYCNASKATVERCSYNCAVCVYNICSECCPACAVEKNNKAWAKYLKKHYHCHMTDRTAFDLEDVHVLVAIPASDWEQIKKLAEEKVYG